MKYKATQLNPVMCESFRMDQTYCLGQMIDNRQALLLKQSGSGIDVVDHEKDCRPYQITGEQLVGALDILGAQAGAHLFIARRFPNDEDKDAYNRLAAFYTNLTLLSRTENGYQAVGTVTLDL